MTRYNFLMNIVSITINEIHYNPITPPVRAQHQRQEAPRTSQNW